MREPQLPVAAFIAPVQEAIRHFQQFGYILPRAVEDEPIVTESDYLVCHPAALEERYRPLADFKDNPGFVGTLLADHAESPMLVVRNGLVCVPWSAVNNYCTGGTDPISWELDEDDIPIRELP
jgi:hypothetical protein